MQEEILRLNLEIILPGDIGRLMTLVTQPSLIGIIKEVQKEEPKLLKIKEEVEAELRQDIIIHADGSLQFGSRLVYHMGNFEVSCSLKPTVHLIRYTLAVLKCIETSSNIFGGTG